MRKIFFCGVFCGVFLLVYGCHNRDSRELIVYNKSDKSIYSIISNNDEMAGQSYYDEFWEDAKKDKNKTVYEFHFNKIVTDTKQANYDAPLYWDIFFESIPDKKLRLFIVSKDSVDKYGWKTIFKKQIYNKKYLLTIEDLEKRNWEVVYK